MDNTLYRRLEYALYGTVIAVSVVVAVLTERLDYSLQKQVLAADIARTSQEFAFRLEAQIAQLLASANGLAAAVAMNPDIDDRQFAEAAARLGTDDTVVRSISLATDGIVRRVYPEGQASPMMGKDLTSLPNHTEGMEQARQTGQPVLLGPMDLVRRGRSLILRLAFAPDLEDRGPASRTHVISIVVDAARFFDTQAEADPGAVVTAVSRVEDGVVIWGDRSTLDHQPLFRTVATPSDAWQIAAAPAQGWPVMSSHAPAIAGLALLRMLIVCAVLRVVFRLIRRQKGAEKQLTNAIEALDDGFAVFDSQDRLRISNERYREIYKTSGDLLVPGATFEEILRGGVARGQYPDAIGQEEAWIGKRMASHRLGGSVIEQKLDDGRWLRVVERTTGDGSIVGFRVDITELKAATEAAKAAERAKSDFIAILSHELRTPLTITMGYVSLLADAGSLPNVRALQDSLVADGRPDDAERLRGVLRMIEEMGAKAHRSALQLLGLMNHLLDFSKIEAGKMTFDGTALNVEEVLDDLEGAFAQAARTKGLQFVLSGVPATVWADPVRLRQILTNLLSNAVKFTDAGRIEVRASVQGAMVLFEVEDTGCGVSDDLAGKLFNPFEQADASAVRRAQGTGLGLSISKSLVEMMGGEIGFESRVGEGSRFWFTVPLANG